MSVRPELLIPDWTMSASAVDPSPLISSAPSSIAIVSRGTNPPSRPSARAASCPEAGPRRAPARAQTASSPRPPHRSRDRGHRSACQADLSVHGYTHRRPISDVHLMFAGQKERERGRSRSHGREVHVLFTEEAADQRRRAAVRRSVLLLSNEAVFMAAYFDQRRSSDPAGATAHPVDGLIRHAETTLQQVALGGDDMETLGSVGGKVSATAVAEP